MGLIRQSQKIHLYTGTHKDKCVNKVDISKRYTVCGGILKHFSTDDWKKADKKYSEWSKEKLLTLIN